MAFWSLHFLLKMWVIRTNLLQSLKSGQTRQKNRKPVRISRWHAAQTWPSRVSFREIPASDRESSGHRTMNLYGGTWNVSRLIQVCFLCLRQHSSSISYLTKRAKVAPAKVSRILNRGFQTFRTSYSAILLIGRSGAICVLVFLLIPPVSNLFI